MSSIITFFVAPDDPAAAGVADGGPGAEFASATYGNFDIWSTLDEWESLLTGRDLDELITRASEVISADDDPPVLLVPAALTAALAGADAATLDRTAAGWTELRAREGETIDAPLARDMVGAVAALSAEARRGDGSLYCWVG